MPILLCCSWLCPLGAWVLAIESWGPEASFGFELFLFFLAKSCSAFTKLSEFPHEVESSQLYAPKAASTITLEIDICLFGHHVRLIWESTLKITKSTFVKLKGTPLNLPGDFKKDMMAVPSIYSLPRSYFLVWESCCLEELEMKSSFIFQPRKFGFPVYL